MEKRLGIPGLCQRLFASSVILDSVSTLEADIENASLQVVSPVFTVNNET